jgi:hypothetical protein
MGMAALRGSLGASPVADAETNAPAITLTTKGIAIIASSYKIVHRFTEDEQAEKATSLRRPQW